VRIHLPDAAIPKVTTPAANPQHYFEMTFNAEAGRPYRLWIRARAQNDFWGNDSVWVQFSGSVTSTGTPIFRIGTTSATDINLEDCSGCGLSGWGWQDNGWGVGVLGPQIFFQSTGIHTLRVQNREDGMSIDQIVLSPITYLNNSPGALKNDNTVLPLSGQPPPQQPPTVNSVSPNSGPTTGGTFVTISGSNFLAGATVKFDNIAAANVTVASSNTITAIVPAHPVGSVNVLVTNSDGRSGTLTNGFTYTTAPEVTLLADNFDDNSLPAAKWIRDNLFSGFTDPSVPVIETNQRLHIGPLPLGQTGSRYNGIRSASNYDFRGAYSYVELVQAPAAATKADVMFTIGKDAHNYYRIYVEAGTFVCQARIGGTKRNLLTAVYNPVTDRYWRIRHDQATGDVVFETATDNSGAPGSWTVRYRERWDVTSVPVTAVIFELKAGTWQAESAAPGLVVFDNFKAARP
jgi:hypothetical protein